MAYGISAKIADVKSAKIFNQSNKAKSLSIQRLQAHPLNMGKEALKEKFRNAFKNFSQAQIGELLVNANLALRYGIYAMLVFSTLSGWY